MKNKLKKALLSISLLSVSLASIGGVISNKSETTKNNYSSNEKVTFNASSGSTRAVSFRYDNSNVPAPVSELTAKDAMKEINRIGTNVYTTFSNWINQFLSDSKYRASHPNITQYRQETGEIYLESINVYYLSNNIAMDNHTIYPRVWIRGCMLPKNTYVQFNGSSPWSAFGTTPVTIINNDSQKLIEFVNNTCIQNIGINGNVVKSINISNRSDTEGWIEINRITLSQYRDDYYKLIESDITFDNTIRITGFYKGTYLRNTNSSIPSSLNTIYPSAIDVSNNIFVQYLKDSTLKVIPSNASAQNNYFINKINTIPNNKTGELTISSIELSEYIDSNGNTVSGYKVFEPVEPIILSGFKTGSLETSVQTSLPPVEGALANLIPFQITATGELKQFLIDNLLQNLPSNFNVNNIIGIQFGARDNAAGTIKIESITINKYLDENGDSISRSRTIDGPWTLTGFSRDASVPNDFIPNDSQSAIINTYNTPWWIWLIIGLSVLLLILIIISISYAIIKNKKTKSRRINVATPVRAINYLPKPSPYQNRIGTTQNQQPQLNAQSRRQQSRPTSTKNETNVVVSAPRGYYPKNK